MVVAVGVDACKTGWIAVAVDDTGVLAAHYLPSITALATAVPDAKVVGIDIPIGLPESGRREADVAARLRLGARRNSVFFTPTRPVVEAATHAEASAASVRLSGVGISRQAFALAPKLLEVDDWMTRAPCPEYEVHPEISFAVLLGAPAAAPKKSWAGVAERRRALDGAGLSLNGVHGEATVRAGVDDMLDAAVAAWSARRIARGLAVTIPESAPTGPTGDSLRSGRDHRSMPLNEPDRTGLRTEHHDRTTALCCSRCAPNGISAVALWNVRPPRPVGRRTGVRDAERTALVPAR